MAKTLTITEARSQLLDLAEQLNRPPATKAVTVTKRGKPVLTTMPLRFLRESAGDAGGPGG